MKSLSSTAINFFSFTCHEKPYVLANLSRESLTDPANVMPCFPNFEFLTFMNFGETVTPGNCFARSIMTFFNSVLAPHVLDTTDLPIAADDAKDMTSVTISLPCLLEKEVVTDPLKRVYSFVFIHPASIVMLLFLEFANIDLVSVFKLYNCTTVGVAVVILCL